MPRYEVKIIRHVRTAEVGWTEIEANDEEDAREEAIRLAMEGDESIHFEEDNDFYDCEETEVDYCERIGD